jgi:hypothetical protein
MHPKLRDLYSTFPSTVGGLKNLMFYGPMGIGKYTQVLSCIQKYSPSDLKYEKRLTVTYDKEQYLIKMSDIHFEIDMSLLGCNAKLLWNEIYTQIIDVVISSISHNQVGIIVCTNFHKINSELLDNFYSYMQGINSVRLKYIIITEHVGFIPDNILNNCRIINVPKPPLTVYNKCCAINIEFDKLKVKNVTNINVTNINVTNINVTNINVTNINATNINATSIMNENTTTTKNILKKNAKHTSASIINFTNNFNMCNTSQHQPHEKICNDILERIKNPDQLVFLSFRDMLYDILIYNYDLGECIWYILNDLIKTKYLIMNDLSDILINTYTSLQYFNNNYRPIYHLENYMYNLITKIHRYDDYCGKNKN